MSKEIQSEPQPEIKHNESPFGQYDPDRNENLIHQAEIIKEKNRVLGESQIITWEILLRDFDI